MTLNKLLRFTTLQRRRFLSIGQFLYGRNVRHEELTKLNNKLIESQNHTYTFQYLWVSDMVGKTAMAN